MDYVQFSCPLCEGAFQVEPAWQGQQVACPHCGEAVAIPLFEDEANRQGVPADFALTGISPEPQVSEDVPSIVVEKPDLVENPGQSKPTQHVAESPVERLLSERHRPAANEQSPFAIHDIPQEMENNRGEKVTLRNLSPGEKARYRLRIHVFVAVGAAALLAILLFVLLQLG